MRYPRYNLRGVSKIRRVVYWLGFRPKPGSVFYSPSLALISDYDAAAIVAAFEQGAAESQRLMDESDDQEA